MNWEPPTVIICFNCPSDIRGLLDALVRQGDYKNDSEAIITAIRNLAVLHAHLQDKPSIDIEPSRSTVKRPKGIKVPPRIPAPRLRASVAMESDEEEGEEERSTLAPNVALTVPAVFTRLEASPPLKMIAPEPDDVWAASGPVPIDRWLFGQYNRLFPAKATTRALSTLLLSGHAGESIEDLAGQVAREAGVLGDVLAARDSASEVGRDDALATAFPSSQGPNSEKGVLRYTTQFVVSVNSNGQLSGLLVGLKLANRLNGPKSAVSLTEAGWEFARLPNPVLDDGADGRNGKFSSDEIQFMLRHIRETVPAERFAYQKVLEAIESGNKTPESLDSALAVLKSKNLSPSFLSTQRSGAVSRMSDLGLVARERSGVRVEYVATDLGRQFLSTLIRKED